MEPRMSKKEEKSLYILGWMLLGSSTSSGDHKGFTYADENLFPSLRLSGADRLLLSGLRGHQGLCCPSAGKDREILSLPSCGAVHGCHLWLVHDHTYNRISDQGKAGGGDAVPRPVSLFSSRHHTDTVGSAESPETDMGN